MHTHPPLLQVLVVFDFSVCPFWLFCPFLGPLSFLFEADVLLNNLSFLLEKALPWRSWAQCSSPSPFFLSAKLDSFNSSFGHKMRISPPFPFNLWVFFFETPWKIFFALSPPPMSFFLQRTFNFAEAFASLRCGELFPLRPLSRPFSFLLASNPPPPFSWRGLYFAKENGPLPTRKISRFPITSFFPRFSPPHWSV